MIRPPFTTPNWSDHKAYCAHCSNSGMVVIDGYSREVITTEGAALTIDESKVRVVDEAEVRRAEQLAKLDAMYDGGAS
jgi:hypothetical protein